MISLSPYAFIHTGLIIRLLRHSKDFTVQAVIEESKKLDANFTEAGFVVSAEGLQDLREFTKKLETETNKNRQMLDAEVSELSDIMAVDEKMVFAESQTKKVFVLSERRYSLKYLLYQPEKMFKDKVFGKLPAIAQRDLKEGFRCILEKRKGREKGTFYFSLAQEASEGVRWHHASHRTGLCGRHLLPRD